MQALAAELMVVGVAIVFDDKWSPVGIVFSLGPGTPNLNYYAVISTILVDKTVSGCCYKK